MEVKREKYPEAKFLVARLNVLNDHAKRAFRLQQIGSVIAFAVVLAGIFLTYLGTLELAIVQSVSTIAVSLVTYLFYRQSNRANDDANKFALISIKFNEAWNIVEEAMDHCRYMSDAKSRNEAVKKIIDRQLEMALSEKIWELKLDLQKAHISEDKEKTIVEQPR